MNRLTSSLAAFAACIVLTTCAIFAQSHERTIVAAPANGVYLGASAGPPPAARAMAQLESDIGRKLLLHVYFVNKFNEMGKIDTDPAVAADFQNGRIPVISWGCGTGPGTPPQPTLPQIASGSSDGTIDAAASALKREGSHLFMIRFMWEMNMNVGMNERNVNGNNCFSSSDPTQDAHEYVAAQRHIEDRFSRDGVVNVTWLWCPAGSNQVIRRQGADLLRALYPGNQYVDWICFDAYERGGAGAGGRGGRMMAPRATGVEATMGDFVQMFSGFGKPMMIAETGERADGSGPQTQADFIADLERTLRPGGAFYPYVKAVCYFHQTPRASGIPWTLDEGGKAAYRTMGLDSYFSPRLQTARVSTP